MYHCSQVKPGCIDMKRKLIGAESQKLLSYFNQRNQLWFKLSEAFDAVPNSSESAVLELVADMAKRGLLMRIKKGIYYVIPYEADATSFMPDWHMLAGSLVGNASYYIGYYSALQVHQLITQPSLKEQIVVSEQVRPSLLRIKKTPFQFIYHNPKHFFGYSETWIDSFNKVPCSDLEKTIIDCLFKPEYAGGIVEIAKAIFQSREKIKYDRLLSYAVQFKSQAVIKRLGFILELMGIQHPIISNLQKVRTASYVVLDTELPKKGKLVSRWSIKQNLESETITSALST